MNKKCSTMFLCCAIALGAQAADGTAKTDVLGRHVSSTQKVPKAYLKDIKKTTEQKAVIKNAGPQQQKALALTHYVNPPMITTSGVFGVILKSCISSTEIPCLKLSTRTRLSRLKTLMFRDCSMPRLILGIIRRARITSLPRLQQRTNARDSLLVQ